MRALVAASILITLATDCHPTETPKTARSTRATSSRPAHLVDLTHTLSSTFPFIPVQNKTFPFRLAPIATLDADGVYANRWELTEHVGTHLDAPNPFHPGGVGVALELLLTRRGIAGLGPDTLSIDPGQDRRYPVHKRLFAANEWALECLAGLAEIPATGATVFVAPLKVAGASGAPARVVAFW